MKAMKVAQALKEKSRLTKELKNVQEKIRKYNSLEIEQASKIAGKSERLQAEEKALVDAIVEIKTRISRSNNPVVDRIFRMSELKSLIVVLGNLNTKEGSVKEGYQATTPTVYVAQITEQMRDEMKANLQKEINSLQDELDLFNAITDC